MSSEQVAPRRGTPEWRRERRRKKRKDALLGGGIAILVLGELLALAALAVGWFYHLLLTRPGTAILILLAIPFAVLAVGSIGGIISAIWEISRKTFEKRRKQDNVASRRETSERCRKERRAQLLSRWATLLGISIPVTMTVVLVVGWYHLLLVRPDLPIYIWFVGLGLLAGIFGGIEKAQEQPITDEEYLAFWGQVAAVALGFGLGSLFFGDD